MLINLCLFLFLVSCISVRSYVTHASVYLSLSLSLSSKVSIYGLAFEILSIVHLTFCIHFSISLFLFVLLPLLSLLVGAVLTVCDDSVTSLLCLHFFLSLCFPHSTALYLSFTSFLHIHIHVLYFFSSLSL